MSENIYRDAIQEPSDRLILALDNMTRHQAGGLVSETRQSVGIGKANSIAQRPGWDSTVSMIYQSGAGTLTMADTKFHDIPQTVELQVEAVTQAGAGLITLHASGSEGMMRAAVIGRDRGLDSLRHMQKMVDIGEMSEIDLYLLRRREQLGGLLGITVLTSLDTDECVSIYGNEPEKKVVQFAKMAEASGIDGIVCSGKELRAVRAISALDGLITVVPGITPNWTQKAGDQKRVVTPTEALQNGADFIVVGRAITKPPEGISSAEAAERVVQEIKEAA